MTRNVVFLQNFRKQDAIWSCSNCHCILHLTCVQRWGKDSIFQQKNDLETEFPGDSVIVGLMCT